MLIYINYYKLSKFCFFRLDSQTRKAQAEPPALGGEQMDQLASFFTFGAFGLLR
jgi:hypothetical protein